MKKLIPFIFLQLFAVMAFSQSQSDSNYSLGLKLFGIEEEPKLLNEIRDNSKFHTSGLNGLMLKINDNQISYRFSVSTYGEKDYSFTNECTNCDLVTGKYHTLNIKVGFERSLIYSRLQPFYGADLGFKKVSFDGSSRDKQTAAFRYNANIEKNGGTFNPFIGIKYNIIGALTIAAEAGFDFIYTQDKEIKTQSDNTLISVNNFNRWQYNSRPLAQLSIQFNFGKD